MRKILKNIFFTGVSLALLLTPLVLSAQSRLQPIANEILPSRSINEPGTSTAAIATGDLVGSVLPQAINIFLSVVATISFCMFLYSGINLVISQGNEDDFKKFKTMMVWSVVGLLFITMAYAIVRGVLELNFEI